MSRFINSQASLSWNYLQVCVVLVLLLDQLGRHSSILYFIVSVYQLCIAFIVNKCQHINRNFKRNLLKGLTKDLNDKYVEWICCLMGEFATVLDATLKKKLPLS